MTEIQRRADMPAKINYAKALADSGLLPKEYRKQPANVLWAMEYADMLGLPPMSAITGIHVIDGKPTASAGLISGLVRRAGHRLRITGDDQHAVAEIRRCDDPDFTFKAEWTIDRARNAGLLDKKGDTWQRYPAAMLKARAVTEVARDACEEALSGVHYTAEELGAEVDESGQVIQGQAEPGTEKPAQQQQDDPWYVRPPQGPSAQEIADAAHDPEITVDAVRTLWDQAKRQQVLDAEVADPATGEANDLRSVLTDRGQVANENDAAETEDQAATDEAAAETGGEA